MHHALLLACGISLILVLFPELLMTKQHEYSQLEFCMLWQYGQPSWVAHGDDTRTRFLETSLWESILQLMASINIHNSGNSAEGSTLTSVTFEAQWFPIGPRDSYTASPRPSNPSTAKWAKAEKEHLVHWALAAEGPTSTSPGAMAQNQMTSVHHKTATQTHSTPAPHENDADDMDVKQELEVQGNSLSTDLPLADDENMHWDTEVPEHSRSTRQKMQDKGKGQESASSSLSLHDRPDMGKRKAGDRQTRSSVFSPQKKPACKCTSDTSSSKLPKKQKLLDTLSSLSNQGNKDKDDLPSADILFQHLEILFNQLGCENESTLDALPELVSPPLDGDAVVLVVYKPSWYLPLLTFLVAQSQMYFMLSYYFPFFSIFTTKHQWKASPQEFGAALALASICLLYISRLV
ncbi:hypothetical protein BS47DRAFT_1445092 [Hydnum rufescens UP504]|uniref:Uncharacterized protein n=1 Tax=Hydnum rufescens UP504 TaxID=1448309 RepID=A0A9P6B3S9_9AGAM|nr:hypothetical protein BS47DRAFT_1445092 [Hydnum rufescens UP504]